MAKFKTNGVSVRELKVALQENRVLTKEEQEAYEHIVLAGKQVQDFIAGVGGLAKAYAILAETAANPFKEAARVQMRIAQALHETLSGARLLRQASIVIRTPLIGVIPNLNSLSSSQFQRPQIFVQPDPVYTPIEQKVFPDPRRKKLLPLTAVSVEKNGFMLRDQHIYGMTRKSQTGRLFELIIDPSLEGIVNDESIGEKLAMNADNYEAWGIVMRDLKKILRNNKLELNGQRLKTTKQYHMKGITQRIRKPKRVKKIDKTSKLS